MLNWFNEGFALSAIEMVIFWSTKYHWQLNVVFGLFLTTIVISWFRWVMRVISARFLMGKPKRKLKYTSLL